MEALRERAAGFVAAQTGEPFLVPSVRFATQEELAAELRAMSEDLLPEGLWKKMLRPLEDQMLRFLSGRIMGLYTQRYMEDRPSEILLQKSNIAELAPQLGLTEEEAQLWILSHEMFHAAQLDPHMPLREHLQMQVRSFLQTREGLSDLRAAYTWIEGSADWLMDRPGLLHSYQIEEARRALLLRRQQVSWATLLLRILGNKQEQYGKGRDLLELALQENGREVLMMPVHRPELLPRGEEDGKTWASRLRNS